MKPSAWAKPEEKVHNNNVGTNSATGKILYIIYCLLNFLCMIFGMASPLFINPGEPFLLNI